MRGVALRKLISGEIRMISDEMFILPQNRLSACLQVRKRKESESLLSVHSGVSMKGGVIVCVCVCVCVCVQIVCKDEKQRWKERSGPCSVILFVDFLSLRSQRRLS